VILKKKLLHRRAKTALIFAFYIIFVNLKVVRNMKVDKEFNRALQRGACDVIDTILETGYVPNPNSIIVPCTRGNLDVFTRLLKYPMNLQQGLFSAIKHKHIDLLNHLYLAGADINVTDDEGNTLLHDNRDIDICKWLLDMGIRQVGNSRGETPLLRALRCPYRSHSEIFTMVKLLLNNKADHSPDENGVTPLIEACKKYNLQIVDFLILRGATQVCDNQGNYPLHHTCMIEKNLNHLIVIPTEILLRAQIIKCLLENGANVNARNTYGQTPLHITCKNDSRIFAHILLNRGAEQIPDNHGDYPLHYTCQDGDKWAMAKLLMKYTPSFSPNFRGETPLHIASRCNLGCTRVILQHLFPTSRKKSGVDPNEGLDPKGILNMTDCRGYTALHEACSSNCYSIAKKLLKAGAGQSPSGNGNTPLHLAHRNNNPEMVKLLIYYGNNLSVI